MVKKLKSVIVYESYPKNHKNTENINILIIYDGNKENLQHLSNHEGKFDVTMFSINYIKNNIINRRDLFNYRILYRQNLFKNLSWKNYERKNINSTQENATLSSLLLLALA